jgi:peptidoglycan/LPS O-acetylase OafA/YrhL
MRNEIKPLTGIRGVAAFLVMLYHMHFVSAFSGFYPFFIRKAYLSVDLFFILSGFVLALRYGKDFVNGLETVKLGNFMRHRFGRIYPAYLVISILDYARSMVHHSISFTGYDIWANFLLIQSWGIGASSISGNSWSISTEILAYFLFPILIYGVIGRRPVGVAALTVFSIAGIFAVAWSHLGISGPLDVIEKSSPLPLLRCLAEFCLGVVAYKVSQHPICKRILSPDTAIVSVLFGIAALLWIRDSDVAVVLLMVFLIVCLSYSGRVSAALFGNRLTYHLGVISYSLYLVHPMFRGIAGSLAIFARNHGLPAPAGLFVLLAIALSWGAASLSQRFIEVPGRHLVDRLANWSLRPVQQPD